MKRLPTALAAAGLFALAACGGGRSLNNAAALDNTADFFNVTADDLGGNDMMSDNMAGGNMATGNGSAGRAATNNAAGPNRPPAHSARNSH